MSIPSCYGVQMSFDSESMPMSNDHQLLPGDTNSIQWSEEDISNVIAVIKSGEASSKVRAQSNASSNDNEDSMPMSDDEEPPPGNPNHVQLSEEEISDLVAAIESDESSPEVCSQSDVSSNDTEDSMSMSDDEEPLPGNPNPVQLSEEEISDMVEAIESDESSPEVCAQSDPSFNDTEDSMPMSSDRQLLPDNSDFSQWSISELIAAIESGEASSKVRAQSNASSNDTEGSMPMSNDQQPLTGNPNVVQWSEEDISNLVAGIQSGEASPEVWAKLDAFFNDTEDFLRDINKTILAGPVDPHVDGLNHDSNCDFNYDEPQELQHETSDELEYVEDPQVTFPTLENSTTPVADLPQLSQSDPELDYTSQPSPVPDHVMDEPPSAYDAQPSAAPQGPAWSQHEHNPEYHANGPPGAYHSQSSATVQAPLQGHVLPQHGYHPAPSHSNQQPHTVAGPSNANYPTTAFHQGQGAPLQTGYYPAPSHPNQQPHIVAGPSNTNYPTTAFHQGQGAPLQTGYYPAPFHFNQQPHTVAGPSNANYPTVAFHQGQDAPLQTGGTGAVSFIQRRKRKSRNTAKSGDNSFAPQKPQKRRRLDGTDSKEGKFGPYMPADASATVMVMPVYDPEPVDISNRRTVDPSGKPLRTRRFGVMELDDSYFHGAGGVMKDLSPGLTCVRSCDWTDEPCGLFVEMDKFHIDEHLWHWHGVNKKAVITCKFEDCSGANKISQLGRHVEGVHFDTAYQCPYCSELRSRTDSLRRHLRGCAEYNACIAHAHNGGYQFHPRDMIKSVNGYIVPAANAT